MTTTTTAPARPNLFVKALWVFPDTGEVEFAQDGRITRTVATMDEYMDGQLVRFLNGQNVVVDF